MNIYDIKQPEDIKECSIAQLQDLAQQIRVFLIQSIAKTGGHLSSNLGVVELTLAMHYVVRKVNTMSGRPGIPPPHCQRHWAWQ